MDRPNANFGGGGKKVNQRKKKKKKKKRKKKFPPGRGPGFSLIFMKDFSPQNREDMSKKGQFFFFFELRAKRSVHFA